MNNSGFALMEIIVAMVLLAAVSAVAFSSFSTSTQMLQTPNNSALNVARGVLDQLHEYVRADQWTTAGQRLNPTAPGPNFPNQVLNGVTFTPNYTVASKDPDSAGSADDYRKVDVTITW